MDASAHVQYEANPVFWLATRAGKMGRDWLILIQFSQTLHHEYTQTCAVSRQSICNNLILRVLPSAFGFQARQCLTM